MKEKIEGQASDSIRVKMQDIKFNFEKKKTISENQYHNMMMAQILQLEKCTTLSLEEAALKNEIQNKGLSQKIENNELNENIGSELSQYSQNQVK